MTPPGLSHRSRAAITGTSMPSSIPNPPSHSDTMTSTRSGGSISITSSWITRTMSATPFATASSWARTAIVVCSTAYTRAAPAFAARMLRMPLPAPTSSTTSPGLTIASIARRNAFVRTSSRIIERWTSNSAYIGSGECMIGVRIGRL